MVRMVMINMILFGIVFFILGRTGITYETWEFWGILAGVVGVQINNGI